jgi:hypothetical protein
MLATATCPAFRKLQLGCCLFESVSSSASTRLGKEALCLEASAAGVSPWRLGFDSRAVHNVFCGESGPEKALIRARPSSPVIYHSTITPN